MRRRTEASQGQPQMGVLRKSSSFCRCRNEVPEGVKIVEGASYVFSTDPEGADPDVGVNSRDRIPEGADLKRREADNIVEQ